MGKNIKNNDIKKKTRIINRDRKIICYIYLYKEFFASKFNFYKNLSKMREKIITDELKIAKITQDDEVLFIGSGFLPSTPIIIAEKTKAKKIFTIDNSKIVVNFGKSYINKKGLLDKIKIEHADGMNYPIDSFDVIFIATNVWPIEPILKHIYNHMKDTARIICRDMKNDINYILENEGLKDKFQIASISLHPHNHNFKSLLLIKKVVKQKNK